METDPTGALARERAWDTHYDLISFRQGWDQCALYAFRENKKLRTLLSEIEESLMEEGWCEMPRRIRAALEGKE